MLTFAPSAALALPSPRLASTSVSQRASPPRVARVARSRSVVRMEYNPAEDRPAAGFTYYAEKLNGRAAMVGFMIAIGYEYLRPDDGGLVAVLLGLIGK